MKRFERWKSFAGSTAALVLTVSMIAQTSAQGVSSKSTNNKNMWRGDFGIATGSGFITNTNGAALDTDHPEKKANDPMYRSLSDFKALGIRYIRTDFPWKNFQKTAPVTGNDGYNFDVIDTFLKEINLPEFKDANGQSIFRVIATLGNPPQWATDRAPAWTTDNLASCADTFTQAVIAKANNGADNTDKRKMEQLPFDPTDFASAAAALAGHVSGKINVFEIQNSPNFGGSANGDDGDTRDLTWTIPNPCAYTAVMKAVYPAIHSAQKGNTKPAIVLTGGVGGTNSTTPELHIAGDDFISALYIDGVKGSFDGVASHAYSQPDLPCAAPADGIYTPDNVCTYDSTTNHNDLYGLTNGFDRMLHVREIMKANGDSDKKIWITEFGDPSDQLPRDPGTDCKPKETPASCAANWQATIVTAGLKRASQFSWTGPMCYFVYQDSKAAAGNGETMGLVEKEFKRGTFDANPNPTSEKDNKFYKPAFWAYRSLARSANNSANPGKQDIN